MALKKKIKKVINFKNINIILQAIFIFIIIHIEAIAKYIKIIINEVIKILFFYYYILILVILFILHHTSINTEQSKTYKIRLFLTTIKYKIKDKYKFF